MADGFEAPRRPSYGGSTPQPQVQLEAALRRAGVPDAERVHVSAYLKSLTGADLQNEILLLQHAAATPNAKAAIATYDRVLSMAQESPKAAQRLTTPMRHALLRGVADPKITTNVGNEGILGQAQAELAARTLVHMPQAQFEQAQQLLSRAGQGGAHGLNELRADPWAERAFILKFIAQRSERLRATAADAAPKKGVDTEASRAMDEISGFADDMRAMGRSQLIRVNT
ncbi:MAG: hypothetical protein ACJ8AT_16810 [Hyalangium sp.]|uniref:hypothetical protein n=1 Tax=Hyalangium sp. TaxID=2028555 RepID=UPI0038998009